MTDNPIPGLPYAERVPTTLFHTTAHAEEILAAGFIDGQPLVGLDGPPRRGVSLSATPADVNDGAKGDEVLAVTLPSSFDLDYYAIQEEGRPVWEWYVPASVLNAAATVRLLTETEVEDLL
jgi:hypothetical protein